MPKIYQNAKTYQIIKEHIYECLAAAYVLLWAFTCILMHERVLACSFLCMSVCVLRNDKGKKIWNFTFKKLLQQPTYMEKRQFGEWYAVSQDIKLLVASTIWVCLEGRVSINKIWNTCFIPLGTSTIWTCLQCENKEMAFNYMWYNSGLSQVCTMILATCSDNLS